MEPIVDYSLRRGRPTDVGCAELVFGSAESELASLAGSASSARRALKSLWQRPGHALSFEHAWVCEKAQVPIGLLIGFPAHNRARLIAKLFAHSLLYLSVWRWPLAVVALARLNQLTPAPPRSSFYVMAVAVDPAHRRRGVGSALGQVAARVARTQGHTHISAHTGISHPGAQNALLRTGAYPVASHPKGYILYIKDIV
jgi:GNAT superfamily N-acetyltransferase